MSGIISLYNTDAITEKQQRVISMIEHYCHVKFKGSTKQDAKEFIDKYIYESKMKADMAQFIKKQSRDLWEIIKD